jgi:proton-dependent oligopeptide transporter, POT family
MFKGHPKGLFVAFFTNMGERFGFYTMMAILVLFLQARYGLSEAEAGDYYSWFYYAIYALALVGGFLADLTKKYKAVILAGQIIMFAGYSVVAIPSIPLWTTLTGLFIIALGNGLFKGNLQAVVGQLYDDEKYSKMRDNAFLVFYMGINVGAFFAPFAATAIRNWWLETNGFLHDGSLPALCHQFINGKVTDSAQLQELANKVDINGKYTSDLAGFATGYLDVFSRGYNWAFAVAAIAMVLSLIVYIIFNKSIPNKEKQIVVAGNQAKLNDNLKYIGSAIGVIAITSLLFHFIFNNYKLGLAIGLFIGYVTWIFLASKKEEKKRINALVLVYVVVIFFWMSFHQNGLTLTFFARDYTLKEVDPFTNLFFHLDTILCLIATIFGLVLSLSKSNSFKTKLIGGVLTIVCGIISYYFIINGKVKNPISPEIFQSFNPLFIVALTPLVIGFFAYLNKRELEPSTPRKIGFGMVVAAIGFLIVLIASVKLVSPYLLGDGQSVSDSDRVTPYWLMSSYLVLTIAELFLSPMGLSFTSKVAPQRFQGLMQGGWLLATATGNKLLFVGSFFWGRIDLYLLWGIFLVCCILSAIFIFSIMKRLENATK